MKTQKVPTSLVHFLFSLLLPHIILANGELKQRPTCLPFECGSLGRTGYPFSNATHPECGSLVIDCKPQPPQIHQRGRSYDVKNIFYNNAVLLHDQLLQRRLSSNSCDLDYKFELPASSPFISFVSRTPNFTLYRCSDNYRPTFSSFYEYDDVNIYTYTKCKENIVLHYSYPDQLPSSLISENDSSHCSVIQIPLIARAELPPRHVWEVNPFALCTAEFSFEGNVSSDCLNCYSNGGQCITNNSTQQFECHESGTIINIPPPPKHITGKKVKIGIGAGVGGCLITTSILFFAIFTFKKKGNSKNNNDQNLEVFFKNNESFAPKRFRYMEVNKMTNSFKEKLGEGGYGSVFKGQLQDGRLVAVKILSDKHKSTSNNGEEFLNEVASISRTSHVNIVSLLGFCYEKDKRALIYEFMPNGSLDKFIYNKNISLESSLEWEILYEIAIGIARGLGYLHRGCSTRIIHFDIKPHNILLDEDFSPKIADFGLAKLCPGKESIISMLDARGTAGYIAPEVFNRNFGEVSHKSDVYSYGMMILEMVGGRKNFDVKVGKDHSSQLYFPDWIYDRLNLEGGLGLQGIMIEESEEVVAKKMIIVGLWCIQINPSSRPSMSKVLEMLEGSLEALQIPPKPFLYSPARSWPSATGSSSLIEIK